MTLNLAKNWPAYVMVGLTIIFFIYVIIKGNLPEKKEEENKIKDLTKNKRSS